MKSTTILSIALVLGVVIIVATYILNGAEKDTAWLYLSALAIMLAPAAELYLKRKKDKEK